MKRRIETERLSDPNDLKLGPGGLSDIEWTAQLLQLRHGPDQPRLRAPNTLEALRRLRDDVFLMQADWETLSTTYRQLIAARNHQYLRTGVASNIAPAQSDALLILREAVREICERVFYSRDGSQ
jgi:glutamate-ammonia-ligase adenylyltransferase